MDLATLLGLLLAFGGILGGQALEGGKIGSILQGTAALIVIGGTFGACLVQFPLSVFLTSMKSVGKAFFEPKINNKIIIAEIIGYANKARRQGIVSLEADTEKASDPFMKKALNMAVDGVDSKTLRETMELEIENFEEEGELPVKFWEAAGGYSPTIGIIGAVLGLIHVMENLTDPSKLGGGIAVAFVATVYGVTLANVLYFPIAGKLKLRHRAQMMAREIILAGVISILEGENPRIIEDKLKSFLSKKEQETSLAISSGSDSQAKAA
ncbi:MAG: motA [Acidobacteria bacterium]|nr:motA [Acidobacteriota bacterium]